MTLSAYAFAYVMQKLSNIPPLRWITTVLPVSVSRCLSLEFGLLLKIETKKCLN